MTPFDADGLWLRCALHAHTTNSDGELAPELLVRHYEWAGYDVLAITDHWVRTVEPLDQEAARHPVDRAERLVRRRGERRPRARPRRARPTRCCPRASSRRSQEVVAWIAANGGVPYIAHTYWSGLRTEQWWDCDGPARARGVELGLRARARPRRLVDPLGRGARARAAAATRSPPTTRITRATTAASPGRGFARRRRRRSAVLDALRTGAFYGSTGPAIHGVEVTDDEVIVRCSPAAAVTLYSGRARGARANAGRLGYPNDAAVLERNDDGLITAVALERPCAAAVRPGRGARRRRQRSLDEPAVDRVDALEQLAARRFDLLVDRRRDHRRGHRRGGDGARARGRARRPRRLCVCDLDRLVEADPRRPALPADGRRRPRARGAPGAARADERRRAAPRPPPAVPVPALRRRPAPAVVRPHRRARSTRRSPAPG